MRFRDIQNFDWIPLFADLDHWLPPCKCYNHNEAKSHWQVTTIHYHHFTIFSTFRETLEIFNGYAFTDKLLQLPHNNSRTTTSASETLSFHAARRLKSISYTSSHSEEMFPWIENYNRILFLRKIEEMKRAKSAGLIQPLSSVKHTLCEYIVHRQLARAPWNSQRAEHFEPYRTA